MGRHRWIFLSDIHYAGDEIPRDRDGFSYHYEEGIGYRMQKLISLIQSEHAREPIEAVFFLGDTSHERAVHLEDFCKRYLPMLPHPAFLLPGNHENYPDDVWKELNGNARQFAVDLSGCRILMCDCFCDPRHPHQVQPVDLSFLSEEAGRSKGKPLFICTHYFHGDEALENWICAHPQVVAVFHGHTHRSLPAMDSIGGKPVVSTGNFSYGLNMEQRPDWYRIYGWSVTEALGENGRWTCRKIYPEMNYRFSQFHSDNRFCGEIRCDYDVRQEYGEWILLGTDGMQYADALKNKKSSKEEI